MKVLIDAKVYQLDAVKKAAYRVMAHCSPRISADGGEITCELDFSPSTPESERKATVAEFWKELLDQDLRARISAETAAVRNAILAVAFSPVMSRRG